MRNREKEIFELLNEFQETNFSKLKECKLLEVDEHSQTARVIHNHRELSVPIKMHHIRLDTLIDIGRYYGIKGFLDQEDNLVDYSYITDDLLKVGRTKEGADIYE